jgi:hypothetical protein
VCLRGNTQSSAAPRGGRQKGSDVGTDLRSQRLRCAVAEIIAFETELVVRLELGQQVVRGYPEAVATLECFVPMVRTQRDRLARYMETLGPDLNDGTVDSGFAFSQATTVASVLRQVSDAFSHGATSYAMLFEMALRLYEPPLREVAPDHLEAYAGAAAAVYRLLPAAVAWELAREDLHCSCICPMCGIGVCGCVAVGKLTLVDAWHEATAADASLSGFAIQAPRPESELARAGVGTGERLLAVDGQEVNDFRDIQAAIRKHAIGEELRLTVQRGSDPPRAVVCRHMSDYLNT